MASDALAQQVDANDGLSTDPQSPKATVNDDNIVEQRADLSIFFKCVEVSVRKFNEHLKNKVKRQIFNVVSDVAKESLNNKNSLCEDTILSSPSHLVQRNVSDIKMEMDSSEEDATTEEEGSEEELHYLKDAVCCDNSSDEFDDDDDASLNVKSEHFSGKHLSTSYFILFYYVLFSMLINIHFILFADLENAEMEQTPPAYSPFYAARSQSLDSENVLSLKPSTPPEPRNLNWSIK